MSVPPPRGKPLAVGTPRLRGRSAWTCDLLGLPGRCRVNAAFQSWWYCQATQERGAPESAPVIGQRRRAERRAPALRGDVPRFAQSRSSALRCCARGLRAEAEEFLDASGGA